MSFDNNKKLPEWGRILIAGGTDWPNLGRKAAGGSKESDIATPHILRDISNEKIIGAYTGSSACHAFFVNDQGDLFTIGRNEHGQTGLPIKGKNSAILKTTRLDRQEHFRPPLPDNEEGDILSVACGRNHTILCTKGGAVYTAGSNNVGQCANPNTDGDLETFRKVERGTFVKAKDPVIAVGAGLTFSLILTASGRVYAAGSGEKGQLGNDSTGEHIGPGKKVMFSVESEPILVRALADKKIVKISCGQQHSIALDEDGYVYVWGFGGYGRLGINNSRDQLKPTLVPQFTRENQLTRVKDIVAGPACTVIIDRQRMYWLAGKWKTSGDGGAGQGFMSFKYLPDLTGCKIRKAALGGVTLFATADEDASLRGDYDATMNIAFGQNATNGELGLGIDQPRSATKPQRCEPLDGISVIDFAAGQNTTYFLIRNLGEKYSELPSYPPIEDSSDECLVCGKSDEDREGDELLECERCEAPWHLKCLDPPLNEVPEGEWHCPNCVKQIRIRGSSKASGEKSSSNGNASKKRNASSSNSNSGTPKKSKK